MVEKERGEISFKYTEKESKSDKLPTDRTLHFFLLEHA